jgi:hypothetical protein
MDKWWGSARNMTDDLGLELEGVDVKRILKYFEKIRMSEIMYCEDHDREFLKGEECPGCRSERDDRV